MNVRVTAWGVVLVACGGAQTPTPTVTVVVAPLPVVTQAAVAPPPPSTTNDVGYGATAAPEVFAPGKVTIVHFFASWCMPCTKAMPELDALYQRHHGHVAMIGIGEDDDESSMRAFVAHVGVVFTVLWDSAKGRASRWRPSTMPTTYVIDARGALRFTHAGYHDGDADTLESEVKGLLAAP